MRKKEGESRLTRMKGEGGDLQRARFQLSKGNLKDVFWGISVGAYINDLIYSLRFYSSFSSDSVLSLAVDNCLAL